MEYIARKAPGDSEAWEVVNKETNEVKATHEPPEAEQKARRQVQLLHNIDKEWTEDEDDDE